MNSTNILGGFVTLYKNNKKKLLKKEVALIKDEISRLTKGDPLRKEYKHLYSMGIELINNI